MDSPKELKADALNPESKYTTCPYNTSHRILRARMQYHLVKCKRNVKEKPEEEKSICPFDATHHVNKEEFNEHIKTCPNRKIVDSERYAVESEDAGHEPATAYTIPELPPCEENWDDPDEPAYTYDPTPHLENQPILRTMHGGTRSERKAFRQVERIKMIQFQSGQPMDTAAAATAAGVTIANGKYHGCGRGQNRFPLGRSVFDGPVGGPRIDLEKVVGDEVGHIVPCPVEAGPGPLRPPREPPMALRMAHFNAESDGRRSAMSENRAPSPSSGAIRKVRQPEQAEDFEYQYGRGRPLENGDDQNGRCRPVANEDVRKPKQPEMNWWDGGASGESSSIRQMSDRQQSQTLAEYKESVKESKLAAKLGLPTSPNTQSNENRAHDFTYLDEDWQVLPRRGNRPRGGPPSGALPKARGRNW